jgi:putative Mg2+ transporter-C (MgtC) family protein
MSGSGEMLLGTISWSEAEVILRLAIALVLGGLVGMEREYHGRAAGFRTHALVSLGCCLVMIVSLRVPELFAAPAFTADSVVRLDPARIAYGVMAGMGFLGAGAIVRSGMSIRGLTTAASLWCIAAVGLAMGAGMYILGIGATALVLFTLFVLDYLEERINRRWYKQVKINCQDKPDQIGRFRDLLERHDIRVLDVSFERDLEKGRMAIVFMARLPERAMLPSLYEVLDEQDGVYAIEVFQ